MQFSLRLVFCSALSMTPIAAHAQDIVPTFAGQVSSLEQPAVSDALPDAPVVQDGALAVTSTAEDQQTTQQICICPWAERV